MTMFTFDLFVSILGGVYYGVIAIFTLISFFAIYMLIRYGRSVPLSIVISMVYLIFFMTIVAQSNQTFRSL